MATQLVFHRHLCQPELFTGIQLMECCYCELKEWQFDNLAAPFWRWYCNLDSGAVVILDKRRITLVPERVCLIPPKVSFATQIRSSVRHLYFHFTLGTGLSLGVGQVYDRKASSDELRMVRALVRQTPCNTGQSTAFVAQALINTALSGIPADHWSTRKMDNRIEQAARIIQERVAVPIGNAELARIAGMNTNAFIRLFRQYTGFTPYQYGLRLRLGKACALMRNHQSGLDDIAEASGFCDRFHMSKIFKHYMKVAPAAYRRQICP